MSKKFKFDNLPLTKKRFEGLLMRAAQPVPAKQSCPKVKGTEGNHPSGGCSDKCTSQDKSGDIEGLPSD